jgi:Protein of unknown function (DUF2752)
MMAVDLSAPVPAVRFEARRGAVPLGLIFGGMGLLGALAVGLLHLDNLGFSVCTLKTFTGIPCPTCGGTRAIGCLARLDLLGALRMNPLVAIVALSAIPWLVADLVLLLRGRALDVTISPRMASVLRVLTVAALGFNWLYLLLAGR